MIEPLSTVLNLVSAPAKAMAWFADIRKKRKGDARALIGELKENSRLCFRVTQDQVPPDRAIPKFSTVVFDRLNENGFDFNSLKKKSIQPYEGIENTDLASWVGKTTEDLTNSIYDKIKDIRSLHELSVTTNRRLGPRIININKRILLLLRHTKS